MVSILRHSSVLILIVVQAGLCLSLPDRKMGTALDPKPEGVDDLDQLEAERDKRAARLGPAPYLDDHLLPPLAAQSPLTEDVKDVPRPKAYPILVRVTRQLIMPKNASSTTPRPQEAGPESEPASSHGPSTEKSTGESDTSLAIKVRDDPVPAAIEPENDDDPPVAAATEPTKRPVNGRARKGRMYRRRKLMDGVADHHKKASSVDKHDKLEGQASSFHKVRAASHNKEKLAKKEGRRLAKSLKTLPIAEAKDKKVETDLHRHAIAEDSKIVNIDTTANEGNSRDKRQFFISSISSGLGPNSNFIYPPVNFLANGKPGNVIINPQGQPPLHHPASSGENPSDSPVSDGIAPTPMGTVSSLITWLDGRYRFNGRPTGNIIIIPAPLPPTGEVRGDRRPDGVNSGSGGWLVPPPSTHVLLG